MPLHMTLNQRQPVPEPLFKKGELVFGDRNGTLVIVTEHQILGSHAFKGTVIHPSRSDLQRGETSTSWIASSFTRLDGTVTLEQTP